jgi:ribosome-binding factor A
MLASTIQRELAGTIQRDLTDPRLTGLPSITRVKVAPDLSTADVFITVMGTPGQQQAALHALQHSAGLMRSKLTRSLSLRVAPYLRFQIDENLKRELAVLDLIRKANEEMAQRNPPPPTDDAIADDATNEPGTTE